MFLLGPALKALREDSGLTQDQMATALCARGISITTRGGISRIEERSDAKYALLKAWADACAEAGHPVTVEDIERRASSLATKEVSVT